jgi:hypothetical protein
MSTASPTKAQGRSAVTNGSTLLPGVDGRGAYARRLRDVFRAHVSDLGGDDIISEAERSICRRVATLTCELEHLEYRFATEESDPFLLDAYQRGANTLRRLLQAVGLQRRARELVPSLATYIRRELEAERVE